jgi:hypothetical protein
MIPVEQITEEVLQKRFDVLPKNLQDALSSDRLLDVVKAICTKYLLVDEDKQEIVQQIASLVLLGIVHSYDAASEISDYLQVDPRLGASIAADLDAKVFSSYKDDLEQNFSPIVTESEPETVQEIVPPVASSSAQPMKLEDVQKSSPAATPQPQQSTTLVPAAPKPVTPSPQASQAPKPLILQENASFQPNKKSSDFHVEISEDKLKALSNVPRPAPLKPAILELGVIPKTSQKPLPAQTKYEGEFGSISSKSAPVAGKDRMISEITSVTPAAPLSGMPIPQKAPIAPALAPLQIPVEKPSDQTTSAFFSSAPQPAKTPSIKPVVIQKNYSAADLPPKPPVPPQAPLPPAPIPPQKS